MGIGKTKEIMALIEMRMRSQIALRDDTDSDVDVKFYPTIIVNYSVNTIVQTFQESKQHPTLNVLVYYATQVQFPEKSARVIQPKHLVKTMKRPQRPW